MPRLLKDKTTVPPGGYQYRVPETGLLLQGNTLASVARDAQKHLAANGINKTSHELATLIEDQICQRHPEACYSHPKLSTAPAKPHPKGHKWSVAEVKSGINAFFRYLVPRRFVPEAKSFERATVCASCPLNVNSEACSSCTSGLLNMVKGTIGKTRVQNLDRHFTGSRALRLCDACGCFIHAKVMLDPEAVAASTTPETLSRIRKDAPGCWILKEIE
jgi:hypothetical protein